jgi:hypothetical protein
LRKEKANMDPRSFRIIFITLGLLALACVFILVLVLLGPRVSTEPYSKWLYAYLWGKNSADPYFDRSFDQKWAAHLVF